MIAKPVMNAHLDRMSGLQRAVESFRYVLLNVEFWISPDGKAREWMRMNTRLAVFIAAPTFMGFPIATIALWELSSSINALTNIASKLIFLPILALLTLVSITIVFKIISAVKR